MTTTQDSPYPPRFIRFLGTAGARFTIMRQTRASGGIWVGLGDHAFVIDPGPGSLVRICEAIPPLDVLDLSALILTHRHIDHSTDLNVLAEAMVEGGFRRHGHVVLPDDAMPPSPPCLLPHLQENIEALHFWEEGKKIALPGGTSVEGVRLSHHHVDCFGFTLDIPGLAPLGFVSDTRFEERWLGFYRSCPLLVVNMTFAHHRDGIDHLCPDDVDRLITRLAPERVILTHLGREVLNKGPEAIAKGLSRAGTEVRAATDGMVIDLEFLKRLGHLSPPSKDLIGTTSMSVCEEGLS